jgi:hypothetical protein
MLWDDGRDAHPVVRPGDPPAQRQYRISIDRQQPVEARAQLAPGVGRIAAVETERKAGGDQPGLGVAGRFPWALGTTRAAGCFHFARSFAPSSSRRTSELVNPRSINVSSNA